MSSESITSTTIGNITIHHTSGEANSFRAEFNPPHIKHYAEVIFWDWTKGGSRIDKINYAAAPYLDAMSYLYTWESMFGADTAHEVVARFLCNASTWRGETARAVKKELNYILKHGKLKPSFKSITRTYWENQNG